MTGIAVRNDNLPATLDELSKFVLIGREKLVSVRAEIRAIEKVGLAHEVRQQKLTEAQDIAEAVLDAEVRIGQLMAQVPKQNTHNRAAVRPNTDVKSKTEVIKNMGFTPMQVSRFEALAAHPEIVEQAKAEARENDDIVTRSAALSKINLETKRNTILEAERSIAEQASEETKPILFIGDGIGFKPKEQYDLLLTDPPYSTDVDDIDSFAEEWLFDALNGVKRTGFAYVFIGAYPNELRAYLNATIPPHITLEQVLVWTYKNTLGQSPRDRYKLNYQACLFFRGEAAPALNCPLTCEQWAVQEINAPDGRQGDRYHAWQKPIEIAERFIRHSTEKGMTVFDPFACTGTFLLAAAKLGRKAYGFEIDPDNAQIAYERGCVSG